MTDAPDAELLEQFARNHSEAAFKALVQRHVSLVHSVALRHTSNPGHAQDITQAVFIVLARKAGSLGRKTVLPGWLYNTARLTAANFQRAEARRIRREQEAFMQSTVENSPLDDTWRELSPQLDEAMAGLNAGERDALVLRYFQNQSMAEVGRVMGLPENTAQKRIGRALEKLRKTFLKRGVASTTIIIAGAISANSVQAAPIGLAQTISATAAVKGAVASTSTLTLVKGVLKIMAWSTTKTAVVIGVTVLLAAATTTVTVKEVQKHHNSEAWQLGPVNGKILSQPPFQTAILPTRAAQRKPKDGGGAIWMGDGRIIQINASAEDIVRAAFSPTGGQSITMFDPTRTVVDVPLPPGNYDTLSNPRKGAHEALQAEVRKQFGVTGDIETVTTNVLFLEVFLPHSPGLKLSRKHNTSSSNYSNNSISLQNGGMPQLSQVLEGMTDIPVIDRTGLTNGYDIEIYWPNKGSGQPNRDELKQALRQQVGLDLVEGTAPVDLLFITKAN